MNHPDSRHLAVRALVLGLAAAVLGVLPTVRAVESFESPGIVRAADYLPPDLLRGPDWTVSAEATNDGLNNTYVIVSRFGSWQARSAEQVAARAGEIAALARLEEVSKTKVFLDAVESSVTAPLRLAEDVVERPVETLKGVPGGVGRWFKRTTFRVREAYHDASEAVAEKRAERETGAEAEDGEREDELAEKAETAARRELRKHLRISAAERRWYRELGIDPSTDNEKLRTAIERVARVEGLTGFGMKLVALPSIPGSSQMHKTMDLVWSSDPVDLLRANRRRILAAGLSKATARAFEDSALTLTEQTIFLDSLEELAGVAGRQHLIARASSLKSRERARGLTSITVLLARVHREETPLAEILPGSVLPVARTRAGDLLAVSKAGAVFWTEMVAEAARGFAAIYADQPADERRLYVTGVTSELFDAEVTSLGWKVRSRWQPESTAPGGRQEPEE